MRRSGPVTDDDLAGFVTLEAEKDPCKFGSARAHQAEDTQHLAAVQGEAHIADDSSRSESLCREHYARLWRGLTWRIELLDRAADHQRDHARNREVGLRPEGHQIAVAQHSNIVGERQNIRQDVGDVDYRLPGVPKLFDQRE